MPAAIVAAPLQHVDETFDVRIDIGVRVFQRIAHAGLRREMDDHRKTVVRKQRLHRAAIGKIEFLETEIGLAFQDFETRLLQLRIVIVVDDIETDDVAAVRQQTLRNVKPDEAGGTRHEYRVVGHHFS